MPSLRRSLHYVAALVAYYSGFLWAVRFLRQSVLCRREVCVLGLHRVLSVDEMARTASAPSMVVSAVNFRALLGHLHRKYAVGSLSALHALSSGPRPACVVTFDDGWRDNYTNALPLLREAGVPATVFLITELVGTEGLPWVEQLYQLEHTKNHGWRERLQAALGLSEGAPVGTLVERLKQFSSSDRSRWLEIALAGQPHFAADGVDAMLSWAEVKAMKDDGIEFGGHTASHPLLTYEDEQTTAAELRACREMIANQLGYLPETFAYPNGDWNERVRKQVRDAGFTCAVTTDPGWHALDADSLTTRRVLLHDGNITGPSEKSFSPAMFELTVSGLWN